MSLNGYFVTVLPLFCDVFDFSCPSRLPAQYLADTSVADSQLPRDVAGSNPLVGEFYYSLSHNIWEGPAVYKHTSELVHAAMSYKRERKEVKDEGERQGGCYGCQIQDREKFN